jgi:hypothetical protein
VARKPEPYSGDRSEWGFSELLEWHLKRGTRPNGGVQSVGRTWSTKEFAGHIGATDRTVRNWRRGTTLPANIDAIDRVIFGDTREYAEWRIELREAFGRGNRDVEPEPSAFRERREFRDESRLSIEDFQIYTVETPLILGAALVSLSIFLSSHHNRIRSIEDLETIGGLNDLKFERAANLDDLLEHIVSDAPVSLRDQLKDSIVHAINHQSAVLYNGSVNPANVGQLSKLPTLLKGLAGLSKRQFRVGLFRLSAAIVVIGVSGGIAVYTSFQAAKTIHEIATKVIPAVSARER